MTTTIKNQIVKKDAIEEKRPGEGNGALRGPWRAIFCCQLATALFAKKNTPL
jgi:hypothetical protein